MNDRRLLELAAKAAGFVNFRSAGFKTLYVETGSRPGESGFYWKPLTYDGDALKLAVKLHLSLTLNTASAAAGGVDTNMRQVFERVEVGECGLAGATRRAIVRAAAEIGAAL